MSAKELVWRNVTNPRATGAVHVLDLFSNDRRGGLEIEIRSQVDTNPGSRYYPRSGWYVHCDVAGIACRHMRGVAAKNVDEAKRRALKHVAGSLRRMAADLGRVT